MNKDIIVSSVEIMDAISSDVGVAYFQKLVRVLGEKLGLDYVAIAEVIDRNEEKAQTRAVYGKGELLENFTYDLNGTPCNDVRKSGVCCFPRDIQRLFPEDYLLQEMNVESYIGASLIDSVGKSMGVLILLNEDPIEDNESITAIMRLVVARTAAELERVRTEEALRRALQLSEKMKDALQQRELELSSHIRNTPLGCISWDLDFKCIAWNTAAANIFGYSAEETEGQNIANWIVPSDILPEIEVIFTDLLTHAEGSRSVNRNLTKDRGEIICDWYNTPILNRHGEVISVTSLVLDITESVRHKRQLEIAKEEADRANQFKTNFMANLSHEFRTPLNAIIGFSEILCEELFGELGNQKYKQHVQNIHSSGKLLLDLVNDILDISAVEKGMRALDLQDFDCDALVMKVSTELNGLANQKNIRLILDLNKSQTTKQQRNSIICAEKRAIQQILNNLISNAIKYTLVQGRIYISTEYYNDQFILKVQDTGIGIPQERLEHVLLPFVQVEENAYLAQEGVGLGLSIVKLLVDKHGGHITIESEERVGTTVSIMIPTQYKDTELDKIDNASLV